MSEQLKEVLQIRGLNIRQESADVEDPESRVLVDFDPFQKPGSLVIRKGRVVLLGPLPSSVLRALAKVNGFRYQIAGRAAYREAAAITFPQLAENLQTQITSFRPIDDSHTWAFFADDDFMFKDDGTRTYVWGIDEPLSPDPKLANQTGKTAGDTITAGDYIAAVTQLRYDLDAR
jgi:hypothetical protein